MSVSDLFKTKEKKIREVDNYYLYLLLKSKGKEVVYIGVPYDYNPVDDDDTHDNNIHKQGDEAALQPASTPSPKKVSFLQFHNSRKSKESK